MNAKNVTYLSVITLQQLASVNVLPNKIITVHLFLLFSMCRVSVHYITWKYPKTLIFITRSRDLTGLFTRSLNHWLRLAVFQLYIKS